MSTGKLMTKGLLWETTDTYMEYGQQKDSTVRTMEGDEGFEPSTFGSGGQRSFL
jgi:hypothetical protein